MNSKKKNASDVFFYGISSGLISSLGFITLPILTKTIPPNLYGVWVQIGATIGLLLTFVTIGFQTSVIRFLSGKEDKHTVSSLFHLMVGVVLLNTLVFILITFFFQDNLSIFIFGDVSFRHFVPLTGLWLMAEAIYIMNLSFLRARKKIKLLSLINISQAIIRISILYLVLKVFAGNIETLIISYIIVNIILSVLIYLFEILKPFGFSVKYYDLKNTLKDILKFSLPFLPNGAFIWIMTSSNRYFIVHLLSLSENAVYSVTYSIVNVLSVFYMALGFVVYPLLVELWEKNQKNAVRNLLEKSVRYCIFFTMPSIFGLYILGPKIIQIFATKEYIAPSMLILWLSIGILFLGIFNINEYIVYLIKKTHYYTIFLFIAAVINIILNYLLIKAVGIEGAAISTFISYLFLALGVTLLARKEVGYTLDMKFTFKCIFASLVMIIVIQQIIISSLFMIMLVIFLAAVVYIMVTTFLKCFTQEDMKDLKHIFGFN